MEIAATAKAATKLLKGLLESDITTSYFFLPIKRKNLPLPQKPLNGRSLTLIISSILGLFLITSSIFFPHATERCPAGNLSFIDLKTGNDQVKREFKPLNWQHIPRVYHIRTRLKNGSSLFTPVRHLLK